MTTHSELLDDHVTELRSGSMDNLRVFLQCVRQILCHFNSVRCMVNGQSLSSYKPSHDPRLNA